MPRNPLNQKTIERIREVCEITERLGHATSPMVRQRMKGEQSASCASKYCSRAEKQGLLVADRSAHAVVYQTVPGWRELMASRHEHTDEDDEPDLLKPRFTADEVLHIARCNRVPSSVWALGSRAMSA